MAQLNDTEELRQSLEKILELTLKTAQRLSTVLGECSTRMSDEDEHEIGQRKGTVAEKSAELRQWESVSAARQVGGGKQTKQVSGTGKMNRDAAQAPPLRSELETRGRLAYGCAER